MKVKFILSTCARYVDKNTSIKKTLAKSFGDSKNDPSVETQNLLNGESYSIIQINPGQINVLA